MPTKFVSRVAYYAAAIYPGATAALHRARLWDALKAAVGLTDVDRVVITATAALTVTQCGTLLVDATAGNIVLTLPASGVDADEALYEIDRLDATANTVTFAAAGADTVGGAANIAVLGTMRLRLPAGSTDWRVHSISGTTPAKARAAVGAVGLTGNETITGTKNFTSPIVAPNQLVAAVKMNGTGTPAILSQFNISSITDLGVGQYRLNFATALPDANYYVSVTPSIGGFMGGSNNYLTTSVDISVTSDVGAYSDVALLSVTVHR